MAAGVEAQHHLGARGTFDTEALGTNGNATIGADPDGRAETPNIGPPGATWGRTQDGALFLLGEFPGLLRGHAQFAMGFVGVAMESQSIDVGDCGFDLSDVLTGEIGWESALPELVLALDFAFGLGGELHPMQTMQNSFSPSPTRFIRGVAGALS